MEVASSILYPEIAFVVDIFLVCCKKYPPPIPKYSTMTTRGQKTTASSTDYSSDPELFFSSLHGKSQQTLETDRSTQLKIQEESATLIQHAVRLELESITLKESIEAATEYLKESPQEKIQELSRSMNAIKRDIAFVKTKTNNNHNLLQQGLEKVAVNSELTELLQRSTTNQEKLCHIVDGKLQSLELSVASVMCQTETIQNQQTQQNETISEISKRFDTLDRDIKDIKQFLSLLMPRLMILEKLFVPSPQQAITSSANSAPQPKLKRRKLE